MAVQSARRHQNLVEALVSALDKKGRVVRLSLFLFEANVMPLFKLCAYPGCRRAVPLDETYCDAHKSKAEEMEKLRKKRSDQRRLRNKGSASSRGYGRQWQALRNRFIAQHPYCVECMKQGRLTFAQEVDHITPHRGDPRLLYDEDNLQSLCKVCHSRKTAREDGAYGNAIKK